MDLAGPSLAPWAARRIATGGFGGNISVADKAFPEMLHLIDTHWYQFPPLDPLWHGIQGFTIACLACIAIFGNGMVIYIFSTTKHLRTPSNLLVINLAFSDFSMMFTMAPPMVYNCYNQTWMFGPFFCNIYGMCGSLFGCVSIWTMSVIAWDRYNVIVKGLSAKPLTFKGAAFWLFMVWSTSLGWTVAPVLGWSRYVPEGNLTACGTDYMRDDMPTLTYIWAYTFFCYFLPLGVIVYAYWFIVQAVAAHEKSMREQAKKMNVATLRSGDQANTSVECKLAKVALVTISLWFMAWTPYLVVNVVGMHKLANLNPLGTIWSSLFAKANAVYNPIVYAISHPKYKQALYKKFPSLKCASGEDETASVASGVTNVENEKSTTA
ncbi:rhodopsin [Agrilus planipennis]|uniref:Long wavelength sensitive opsin 1 n=1 Tax=Agrilus planipennis TaxID=224129 RepID=A0A193BIU2_AGRPL|nr:rhodopsin [Agrilus planipennis]ANN11815.1 long wavelength sensitive opsin 1 [Agrilus planipennis]ANN11819.1 long wavelength sensitive opsin 1 [Agrilus planipennis]APY20553.1 long wavelength sensitive opsin 1 [Agrilus planipennis]